MEARKIAALTLGTAAAITAAAVASGALGASNRGTASAGSITLYSAQHDVMTKALVKAFEKQTGITVRVRFGEDAEIANQIIAEGSSSPADVVLTENSPPLVLLAEKNRLAKIAASTYMRVPARYSSPTRSWIGVAGRATALVYNPKLVPASMLPTSILDLAKPAWKGKLAIAPSEADFQPVVAAVIKLKGEARAKTWLRGFEANAKVYNDNEGIVAAVERGQVAAAIIDHYYWFRAYTGSSMKSKLHYIGHRDPGALIDISGAGVLSSSKHAALAQRFVAFAVSKAGQRTLVTSGDFEYPLAAGVAAAPQLTPLAKLSPPRIPVAQLGDGRTALTLLQEVGLL
jgi:iron(III) transport system substrate-binding protein